ncbi:uncharacterized protein LOC141848988 [Brevipalpus obovatus]|uniref:uncharacterized protein LOC141848988 n=1 Tax=Brevipalpus obovatus TaxID=246614 RepID=UPI003D9E9A08
MKLVIVLLIPIDFIISLSHTSRPEGFFFIHYFPLPVSRWTNTSFQIFYNSHYSEFLMSDFGITSKENGLESFFYSLPGGSFLREDNSQVFYFNPNGGSHFVMQKSSTTRVIPLFLTGHLLKIEANSSCGHENNLERNRTSECFSLSVFNTDGKEVSSYGQVTSKVQGNSKWTIEQIYTKVDQIYINLSIKSNHSPMSKYLILRLVPTPDNRLHKSLSVIGFEKELQFIMTEFSINSTLPKYQLLYTVRGTKYFLFRCISGQIEESLQWIFDDCRTNRSKQERIKAIRRSGSSAIPRFSKGNEFFFDKRKDPLDFQLYLSGGKSAHCGTDSIPFQIVESPRNFEYIKAAPVQIFGEKSISLSYGQPINRQFILTYQNRKLYSFSTLDGLTDNSVKFSTLNIMLSPDKEWIFKDINIDVEKSNKIHFLFVDKNHSTLIDHIVELFSCSEFKDCGDCETVGAVLGCEWPENGLRQCTNSSVKGIESSEKPFRCFREEKSEISKGELGMSVTVEIDYIAKPYEKCFLRVHNQLYPANMTSFGNETSIYEGILPALDIEFFDLLIYQVMGPPLVYTKDLRKMTFVKVFRDRSSWLIISAILWMIAIICFIFRWQIDKYLATENNKLRKRKLSSNNIEMAQTEVKTRVSDADEEEFKG